MSSSGCSRASGGFYFRKGKRFWVAVLLVVASMLPVSSGMAQSFEFWKGATSSNWSDDSNWLAQFGWFPGDVFTWQEFPGRAPGDGDMAYISSTLPTMVRTQVQLDVSGLDLLSLSLDKNGVEISGQKFTTETLGIGAETSATINNEIGLTGPMTIRSGANSSLYSNGVLSGSGNLILTNSGDAGGSVYLAGTNTFTGTLQHQAARLVFTQASNLGSTSGAMELGAMRACPVRNWISPGLEMPLSRKRSG